MESQSDPIIRETAEAVLREMDFYRELKRRRNAMSLCKPKAELTAEQEFAYRRSTCDPLLKLMAKNVLEEIQYDRNQRKIGYYFMYAAFLIIFVAVVIVIGLIIWEYKKPPKRRYGYGKY